MQSHEQELTEFTCQVLHLVTLNQLFLQHHAEGINMMLNITFTELLKRF